jgi:FixJ family two-component response regulator
MLLPPSDKPRALVVDDDRAARISLVTLLARGGFEVTDVARADEAVQLVDENPGVFAIAALDVKLAGASGLDLLRDIKQRDSTIEAMMVTGFETVEAAKRALRLGAVDFLTKPFEIQAVSAAAARALMLHQASIATQRRDQEMREILADMGPAAVEWLRLQRGVVHDVRNMLCIVRSYFYHIQTMVEQRSQLGGDEMMTLRSHVGVVGRQVDTIVEILNRQSALGRETTGDGYADVVAVLNDLHLLFQRHPDARHCEIRPRFEAKEVPVVLSTTDVAQLLLNLLLNAAQSSPGRLVIAVEVRLPQRGIGNFETPRGYDAVRMHGVDGLSRTADYVSVTVRDNGGGIPREVMTRLISERISTKGARGTGVGLGTVADTIVRNRGGLAIRSTLGKGTEVELLLPAAMPAATAPP